MLRRDHIFFSLILSMPFIQGSQTPNADVLARQSGGKVVAAIPGTGDSVSHTTPSNAGGFIPVYEGQQPPPELPRTTTNNNGKSNFGGLIGFLYNAGKTSEKEKRALDAASSIDKALSKAQAGVPLTSADYAALGTADLSKGAHNLDITTQYSDAYFEIGKNVATTATKVVEVAKESPAVVAAVVKSVPAESSARAMDELMKTLAPLKNGSHPTLLPNSPIPNLLGNSSGGGKSIGNTFGVLGGVGAVASQTAIVPAATTAAGGGAAAAGGGGTVATTTLVGTLGTAAAVVTVGVAAGVALGYALIPVIDGIFYPGIGWWPSDEKRVAYKANRDALKAAKGSSQIPQYKPRTNSTPPQPNPSPKKPEDEKKERKFNTTQKSDGLRKIKENYRYDKQKQKFILKDNGTPIKCSRTGKDVQGIDWDGQHGDIEAYGKKNHLGSLDPQTFEMYKGPASDGRKL